MSSILKRLVLKSYQSCVKQSRRNLLGIAKSYERTLEKRPYLVQAIQASILMGAGDVVAQTCFSKSDELNIDYIRTFKFGLIGLILTGPSVRFWYGFMDRAIKVKSPLTKTLIKVGIDQIIFAPVFLVIIISTISYLQNQNVELIEHKLRTQYTDILLSNYYVWPWVQIVNFRWTPLNYQVLVTSTVAFLWNIYLSWKTNKDEQEKLSS